MVEDDIQDDPEPPQGVEQQRQSDPEDLYQQQVGKAVELGNLGSLKSLYLYSNHLTGHLPRELGNLSSLNYINIRSNAISGLIPVEITKLANLRDASGLGFYFNALDAEDAGTKTFVDAKHSTYDGYWRDTQTLPPG